MSAFPDLFSDASADYARFRPTYPNELFVWLASQVSEHELALDVATGNGQAALGLAAHFERVVALDASSAQLAAAVAHPRVVYARAPAEATGVAAASASLVTAAQAFHWFNADAFFAESARVLLDGGVVAVWCYGLASITPAVDAAVNRLYTDILGGHWEPQRRLVNEGYRQVEAPHSMVELEHVPTFKMRAEWSLQQLVGYLRTWSALKSWGRTHPGEDALSFIEEALRSSWGNAQMRVVDWPLSVRAFRR